MPADEPTCHRHQDRVSYVSCTRCEQHICGDCQVPASVGFQCPSCVKDSNKGTREARTAYGGKTGGDSEVTRSLLVLNALIFVVTLAGGASLSLGSGDSDLYRLFTMQPVTLREADGSLTAGVADGEYYRLLTAAFLHYGFAHLALNMFALYTLGPELERVLGWARFLALYLLCGVAGNALSYGLGPENVRAAGASGAIYGLAGAWLILMRRRQEDATPVYGFLILGVLITFIPDLNIDWRGHLGGFLAGAALGSALFVGSSPRRTAVQVSGMLFVGIAVVAVVLGRTSVLT